MRKRIHPLEKGRERVDLFLKSCSSVNLDEKVKSLRSEYENKFLVVDREGTFGNSYHVYGRYSRSADGISFKYKIFHNREEVYSGMITVRDMGIAIDRITEHLIEEMLRDISNPD